MGLLGDLANLEHKTSRTTVLALFEEAFAEERKVRLRAREETSSDPGI